MLDQNRAEVTNELGMVLCKVCGDVLYTLPTNGVKKWYSVCEKEQCSKQTREEESN